MTLSVKAVAFPVVGRHWLLHAWQCGKPDATSGPTSAGAQSWLQGISNRLVGAAQEQWRKTRESKEGTFQHRVYQCALTPTVGTPDTNNFLMIHRGCFFTGYSCHAEMFGTSQSRCSIRTTASLRTLTGLSTALWHHYKDDKALHRPLLWVQAGQGRAGVGEPDRSVLQAVL